MKLVIDRAALLRPLGHVQSVVERRNTIPILSNVLLRAGGGRLNLTATDMDMDIVESVACDVAAGGVVTVPALTFYDIVRKLPEGSDIELSASGDVSRVNIRAGRSNFTLPALMPDDFPQLSGDTLPHGFVISAADAAMLIDRTRFAISTEETRYYLNGIYLHAASANGVKVLRAVATDGHRLARVQMPLPDGAAEMPGVIVPRKAVNEIRKLIDEAGDSIEISLSDNKIRFSFDHVMLSSKLIDGTFPDYERVIPKNNDKLVELDPALFVRAVDRVSTISSEKSRAVKLTLGGKTLTLSANSPDSGSASEEIEVSFNAGPMEIGFNSAYLMDVARQIEGEGCRMALSDPASPTIIQDTSDASSLYVLMPMRV